MIFWHFFLKLKWVLVFVMFVTYFFMAFNQNVEAYTLEDTPVFVKKQFGREEPSEYNLPYSVCKLGNNKYAIGDTWNSRIEIADENWAHIKHIDLQTISGSFSAVWGITCDNSGNIYVALNEVDRVVKIDQNGNLLLEIGSAGSGNGQFQSPFRMAVDTLNNIYVTDSIQNRVQKFDSNGNFLLTWGTTGSGNGQFNSITDIFVDSTNNVYTTDRHRVQHFNSSGVFIDSFGSSGSGNGQFSTPYSVYKDSDGNFYVADSGNRRLQKFNSSYVFQQVIGSRGIGDLQFNFPSYIRETYDGNLILMDSDNNRLQIISKSGVFVKALGNAQGGGEFVRIAGMDQDQYGNYYTVESFYSSRVQKFNSDFEFIKSWGGFAFANEDNKFSSPGDIAVGSNDKVYVLDATFPRVTVYDLEGNYLSKWGSSGSGDGQFSSPRGIELDENNNVYIVESGNRRVQVFDQNGVFLRKFGSSGSGDGQFQLPFDLALDENNNIYVADFTNARIQKFNSNGTFLVKWGTNGTGNGQFNSLFGVDIMPDGRVATVESRRVQIFDQSGNYIMSWGGYGRGSFEYRSNLKIHVALSGNDIDLFVVDSFQHGLEWLTFDRTSPVVTFNNTSLYRTSSPSIKGTVTDALTVVTLVEYQINSTDGVWASCTPDDGAWDEKTESYTCSTQGLSDGSYIIYTRATDSKTNTSSSFSKSFTIDTSIAEEVIEEEDEDVIETEEEPMDLPDTGSGDTVEKDGENKDKPADASWKDHVPLLSYVSLTSILSATLIFTTGVSGGIGAVFERIGIFIGLIFPKKRKYWGVIYDSFESRGIPFAVVRLKADSQVIQTTVADLDGKYGLLVDTPGEYILEIKAEGFKEHEVKINIKNVNAEVIGDIGLRRFGGNVNWFKKILFYARKDLVIFLNVVWITFIGLGFVYTLYLYFQTYSLVNLIILSVYLITFFVNLAMIFAMKLREVGEVKDILNQKGIANASIRFYSEERQMLVGLTNKEGALKVNLKKGKYMVYANKEGYEQVSKNGIVINEAGFMNKNILLKQLNKKLDDTGPFS